MSGASGPALLSGLADLGPFFAVAAHSPGADPVPPWRPLRELTGQSAPLLGRISAVRAALADRAGRPVSEVPARVAASVTHHGLAARLIAPAVAAAALAGPGDQLDLRPDGLWWRDEPGGPVPLSVPDGAGQLAAALPGLLDNVILPLSAATARLAGVSERVLAGNAASAISGAAAQVAAKDPSLAPAAWAAARELAAHPWLSGEPAPPGPGFRRSSCCLIYLLERGGRPRQVCGDCVLAPTAG